VQFDTRAAQILTATVTGLTLITLPATLKAHLRAADLPRLRASGPLGELLARQGEAHGEDHGMAELSRAHAGLPDDLLNFQYDPVACAVAVGWPGSVIKEQRFRPVTEGDVLHIEPDQDGRLGRVVVDLDGASFAETWLASVEAAQHR
jgi:purine nucleosidase